MKISGIHVPSNKNTAKMKAVPFFSAKTITVPTVMHIGTPATPIVNVGDKVGVGQKIAEPNSPFSAPIHSGISGTVKKIDNILLSNGNYCPAIVIESDGAMKVSDDIKKPSVNDYSSIIEAVRASGCVGLGGAGFPTSVKLDIKDLSRLEYIVINGAECEPFITSDTRVMLDNTADIKFGIENICKYLKAEKVVMGIEKNKPECIKAMTEMAKGIPGMKVIPLPKLYPQGHEKVLIYQTTGRIVPEGKLPIDAGAIVLNCTTLAKIGEYLRTGMPLVSKLVTVAGNGVKEPKNVLVPIGTPIGDVFEFCGGLKDNVKKILYGGPMMGIAVPDLSSPILKNTNAVLALTEDELLPDEESACINCGNCTRHCPMMLDPTEIEKALRAKDYERLSLLKVNLCMECGCCSYICPANRRLTQYNKLAKAELRKYTNSKKKQ